MKKTKLYLNYAGHCLAKENHALRGGAKKNIAFKALFGLIQHDQLGWILFDTGYTQRFFEATKKYPNKIYANITKVTIAKEDEVIAQLKNFGIEASEINHVIISHFHADHVAGLKDFPNAKIYCSKLAYAAAKKLHPYFSFRKGVLKSLFPEDIESRLLFIEDIGTKVEDDIFNYKFDIFGDKSIYAIDLPGHATGQIGIELETINKKYFLIADACWLKQAYQDLALPHPIVRTFFSSWSDYKTTLKKINEYHIKYKDISIVPTHCSQTTDLLVSKKLDLDAL